MKLIFPPLDDLIDVSNESYVNFVVIENQRLFVNVLTDISNQINGDRGKAVLSDNHSVLDMAKKLEMISSFVPFDINRRALLGKLLKRIEAAMNDEENHIKTKEMIAYNISYLNDILEGFDFNLDFSSDFDLSYILKAADIKFSNSFNLLSEMLIEYMKNVIMLEGDKCFVLINAADYMSVDELELFCRDIVLNKLSAVVIGARDINVCEYQKKIIIDADLCVI